MNKFIASTPSIGFDLLTLPDHALGTGEYLLRTMAAMKRLLPSVEFKILASKSFEAQNQALISEIAFSQKLFIPVPDSQFLKSYLQQSLGPSYWFLRGSSILHSVGYSVPLTLASKRVLSLSRKALRLPTPVLLPTLFGSHHVFVESFKMKEELDQRFPKLQNKTSVICPGVDCDDSLESSKQRLPFNAEIEKYFLHIGSIKEKVRVHNVLEAFAKVAHRPRFKKTGIIFLGCNAQEASEWTATANLLNLAEKVLFLGNQPRKDFVQLLKNCCALIFSGNTFELPPAVYQAVSLEKPVLLSMSNDDKKFFDVAPALVLYDSTSPKNIAEQMSLAISSENLKAWLKDNKSKIREAHSWDRLARSVIQTYQSLTVGNQVSDSFVTSL